ncbi:MAG: DUF6636 domain-containing protein [Crocosphaera sp.]
MMKRLEVLLLLITIWLILTNNTTINPNSKALAAPTKHFVTPSGNIYCALIGEKLNFLRCEIGSMLNPLPPQPYPSYCEFDWGAGLLLPQQGKPEILCISDTVAGSDYTLVYGSVWKNTGFKCLSQTTGLKCTNSSGQGFFLSREKWIVF